MPNTFSDEFFERWEHLISDIEISEVPIRFIREVNIQFNNEKTTKFDIIQLMNRGYAVEKIEETIEDFLDAHDDEIECVDFHINLPALAEEVENKTSKLLD